MKRIFFALLALFALVSLAQAQECRVNGCTTSLNVDAQSEQCCTDEDEAWVCLKSAEGVRLSCGSGHPGQTWCVPAGPGGWDGVVRWCNSTGGSGNGDAYKPLAAGNASGAAAKAQAGAGIIEAQSGIYRQGWLSDWKSAGMIAVIISLAIVALGYMFGFALNSREIKMWASSELTQVFGSLLILASLIGLLAFFDMLSDEIAQQTMEVVALGSACSEDLQVSCSMHVAQTYLGLLSNATSASAQDMLRNSVDAARAASVRYGTQTYTIVLLWGGGSYGPNAGMSMFVDKYNALFDYYAKILASLHAQNYFIDVIAFGIGPIFLFVGVILRTFFFTRKLGGLLLAIAIALMVIYPLTYVFAWLTLTVSIYGDNALSLTDECPAECKINAPAATYFAEDGTKVDIKDEQQFAAAVNLHALQLAGGEVQEIPGGQVLRETLPQGDAGTFVSCADLEGVDSNSCINCPSMCREVPYPSYNQVCLQPGIEAACRQCDVRCKVVRVHSTCGNEEVCALGPAQIASMQAENSACLFGQPMEDITVDEETKIALYPPDPQDGECETCSACPSFCRVRIDNGEGANPRYSVRTDVSACGVDACTSCMQVGGDGRCVLTVQRVGAQTCDQMCTSGGVVCPAYCRVRYVDGSLPAGCPDACNSCPAQCFAAVPQSGICAPAPDGDEERFCQSCPNYCRYRDYSIEPDSSNGEVCSDYVNQDGTGACNNAQCAAQCKAFGLR